MNDPYTGPTKGSSRPREPGAVEVAAQLERVLASADFAQSARLQSFLRFIVEEALAGRGGALKEYTIALDVFERDDSFDPQTSSIVRVEASRLRAKLEKYNAVEGRNDPVRISLPPGGYLPEFRAFDPEPESAPPRGRPRRPPSRILALFVLMAATLSTAGLLLTDLLSSRPAREPTPTAWQASGRYALAVLPLRELSADGGTDYFSVGLTDALITRLARSGTFRVTSMTSVMHYKGLDRPLTEIARELGVSHVIEGSVLRIGDRVRISAQLVEAETGRNVWADSYERNFADLLTLQDEVVGRIEAALSERVEPAARAAPQEQAAIDPAAYEAHLRGRFFLNKMTADGFRKGIAYFKEAIEKAPDYAPAHSGMASCFCLLGGHGFELVKPSEGMPAAKKAVLEALRLDEGLADAHAFLGIIRLKYEWDWPGAEAAFKRSIELDPSYAQARIFYSFLLETLGRQEEAIREAEEARLSDPLSLAANINLGWQYLQANRREQAKQVFESTAVLDPDFWGIHWGLGHYHRSKGDYLRTVAAFQRAIAAGGGHAMPLVALGYTYAVAGQLDGARAMLDRLAALDEEAYVSPYNMAIIHAGLDDKDEAFRWLELAFEGRSRSMAWLNVTKELADLRGDPRFGSLLRRIGLEQ